MCLLAATLPQPYVERQAGSYIFPPEVQRGDPLCETLPQEMHNHASATDRGHRQWCHFLISWWGRCRQGGIVRVSLEGGWQWGRVARRPSERMRPVCLWPRDYSRTSFDTESQGVPTARPERECGMKKKHPQTSRDSSGLSEDKLCIVLETKPLLSFIC